MKRFTALVTVWVWLCCLCGCGAQEAKPIKTIEGNLKTYQEMSDGTWQCDGYTYRYRLEISGRMPAAVKDCTYVYLSNIEDMSFSEAMLASGVSSNLNDYFPLDEAVLVEWETA